MINHVCISRVHFHDVMHTRDPEKFHWCRLQKDVPAEEEGELEEEEDEKVQESDDWSEGSQELH